MPMHRYKIATASDFSLVAATAKTVLQLVTGSTRRAWLAELQVSFSSVTASDAPVLAEVRSQSTAGTSSANTPIVLDSGDPAAIATARDSFTAEPTDVSLLYGPFRLTPVGGLLVYRFPEELVKIAVSARAGIRLTSPANQSGARGYLVFQE